MKRTPIIPKLSDFPSQFHPLLNAPVFDSSCSNVARVYFIDKDGGLFLKRAQKGLLAKEAAMTRFFHSKRATEVLGDLEPGLQPENQRLPEPFPRCLRPGGCQRGSVSHHFRF